MSVSTIGSTVATGIDNTVKSVPTKNFFIVMLLSLYITAISHLSSPLCPSPPVLKTQNPVTECCDRAWRVSLTSRSGEDRIRDISKSIWWRSTPIVKKVKKKIAPRTASRRPSIRPFCVDLGGPCSIEDRGMLKLPRDLPVLFQLFEPQPTPTVVTGCERAKLIPSLPIASSLRILS